mmetsp:Transcript_14807/g.25274  ORF Transcript_14807/g.25274 Transcript_14807/m.25274 type:complete len:340 (-) Transcript_14807:43-1062(-)
MITGNNMEPSSCDSLFQETPDVALSLMSMIEKEQSIYRSYDYINSPTQRCIITESDRMKIVDWCYSIVDKCKFERETVLLAMQLVDRFLSTSTSDLVKGALLSRERFQLVAIASLYIAVKVNENAKVAFSSDAFSEMSEGIYSKHDIEDMEMSILESLSWRVYAPTSWQIAQHILTLLVPNVDLRATKWSYIFDEVQFHTEFAVRDYYFATQRTSTVALAAIFNVVDHVDHQDRRDILHSLLFVLNEDFESPKELFAAWDRLRYFLGENASVANNDSDIPASVSEETAECYDDQQELVVSQCGSPVTATGDCCGQENIICVEISNRDLGSAKVCQRAIG